mmetsp:Transcript_12757/g.18415  ORF Transcript_12757/g.18415 Transcript_12757/m.18415 type:complete len:114 (-) Transcript_12757:185-526(-)
MTAFISGVGIRLGQMDVAKCDVQDAKSGNRSSVVMMACRRNLKYEKRLRNSEYARAHRKKTVRVNRRSENQEKNESDGLYLGEIFNTLNFGGKDENEGGDRRGDRGGDRGKGN